MYLSTEVLDKKIFFCEDKGIEFKITKKNENEQYIYAEFQEP